MYNQWPFLSCTLDESINPLRARPVELVVHVLQNFNANNEGLDQTPPFAASDLGLQCLPMYVYETFLVIKGLQNTCIRHMYIMVVSHWLIERLEVSKNPLALNLTEMVNEPSNTSCI